MKKSSRIILIIVALVILLFISYKHSLYKNGQFQGSKIDLNNEISLLQSLIVNNHDCGQVIQRTTFYISNGVNVPEIWNLLGVCQFDIGKLSEAKVSFQKVLSLEPKNEPAKRYLERLNMSQGAIMVFANTDSVNQTQFEKELGLKLGGVLTFKGAVKKASNIPEYILATYSSSKNFTDTVSFLSEELKKSNLQLSTSKLAEGTVISSFSSEEQKIFSVLKGSPVKVKIEYFKLK